MLVPSGVSLGTISYPWPFSVSACSASRKINNFVLSYPSTMIVCFTMAQKQGSQQNMGWNLRNQDHSESFPIMLFLLGICHTTHTKKSNTKKKIESESETFSAENRKLWALATHSLKTWAGSQQVKGSRPHPRQTLQTLYLLQFLTQAVVSASIRHACCSKAKPTSCSNQKTKLPSITHHVTFCFLMA
jgi:hypothetical protein